MRQLLVIGLLSALLFTFNDSTRAEVSLPPVISSHMVLQRGKPVPIWGKAAPGEKVVVKFREQEKTATAGADGKWAVKLDPLKVGKPGTLTVSGKNTLAFEDVLVGEVWVGSGQSNMAGGVRGYAQRDEVLAKNAAGGPYPQLRLVRGRGGRWQVADEKSINGFSALLFAFGLKLHQDLDVPVGLILGAVGGTPSGYWLSEKAFAGDASVQKTIKQFAANYPYEVNLKKYQAALAKWEIAAAAAKKAKKKPPRKPNPPQKPGQARGRIGHLYEAHIRPVIPFAIQGVLWDQGESGTAVFGVDQYTMMGALIRGWRNDWGQGDFAFLYVQKPSGGGCAWNPKNPVTARADSFVKLPAKVSSDGLYRELHTKIMRYPNTAMVSSSDLGSGVHPINKSGYGQRAARVALGQAYGKKVEIYGPVYDAHTVEGNKLRIRFRHTGQGLAFQHGDKLQGFAVAGADRIFHWADARIEGNEVVVSADKVAKPLSVRYGWSRRKQWANLFNKDGLPAISFRTDNWK